MKWALVVALLALGGGARADEAARRKAHAHRLVTDGRALYDKGSFKASLEKFEEAWRSFPVPKMLFNLGLDYQALHQDDRALCALERFLAEAPDAEASVRADAAERVEKLKPGLGRIDVRSPPGVTVLLDGQERPASAPDVALGKPLCATAGRHALVGRKAGVLPVSLSVEVSAGGVAKVELDPAWNTARLLAAELVSRPSPAAPTAAATPAAVATAAAPAPAPVERAPIWKKWWLWTAVGVVVAGAVITGVAVAARPPHVDAPTGDYGPYRVLAR